MKPLEYAALMTRTGAPVMLESVSIEGDLRGLLFEARVEQRFCNPTDKSVEVAYTFPLPWGAVLLGIEVQLGGKHLSGTVVAKQWAEARYEEALSEGHAAIMLEKNHDLSYTLNLGNLAAGERCVITMRYAQTLQFEQRGLRLLIPTVIAPRFGDAVIDGGLMPHQAPVHSLLVQYPFHLALRLHGDLARAQVASPSHPVGIAHALASLEGGASVLTVSLGRSSWLDRDFVLVIDQLAHDSFAVLARDRVEPGGLAVLASFCPRIPPQGPAFTAVKILVDCSGSMAGDSLEAARRALHAIVEQFGPDDRFSLSRFGSTVEHRSRALWSVTAPTRLAAERWVQDLRADLGGTNMESALDATFSLAQTVPSDVLLVTDGEISAIDSTIAAARASGHRVFVVGMGSAPAEGHLRRLAQASGGACDFVAPGEAVEPAVLRMFARLRSPALSDVHLVWPEGITPWWASPVPRSVFEGDTVSVYALLKGDMPGTVPGTLRLVGRTLADADPVDIGCAQLSSEAGTGDTLARMTAACRMTPGVDDDLGALRSFLTKIAVDYQLVTDQTSFVLVHERDEAFKAKDMPELHKISQMLAAGWSGVGTARGVDTSALCSASVDASVRLCAMNTRGAFDAPAFSRSQGSVPAVYRTRRAEPKVQQAGDTPMALCAWLRSTPESRWPATYDGLRQIGLDRCVVDWLELSMARACDGVLTEQVIVRSFLIVMARKETLDTLNALSPSAPGKKGLMRKLAGLFTAVHGQRRMGVNEPLVEKMVLALHGITADRWPDTVYALDAQASEDGDARFKQALPMKK